MTKKNRTSAYQFTFNVGDLNGELALQDLRKTISKFNKLKLKDYSHRTGGALPVQYRVCVKGRLGTKNVKAMNYKNRGIFSVLLGDASRYDVYVQTRRTL